MKCENVHGGAGLGGVELLWDVSPTKIGVFRLNFLADEDAVLHVAFLPLGQNVLSASREGTFQISSALNGKKIKQFSPGGRNTAGSFLASDGFMVVSIYDIGPLIFSDVKTSQIVKFTNPPNTSGVTCVVYSSDGDLIVVGTVQGTLYARYLQFGMEENDWALIGKHTDQITFVAISPDDSKDVSSPERTATLWDLPSFDAALKGGFVRPQEKKDQSRLSEWPGPLVDLVRSGGLT